jgi:hypothetical protein
MIKFLVATLKGIWIWGLLAWLYVIADIHLCPPCQFYQLSVYVPIEENLFGDLAFGVSLVAFILWEWKKGGRAASGPPTSD